MDDHNPKCIGRYCFTRVARYARKRHVEGIGTISLLNQAETDLEKEEIILVFLLDIDDGKVSHLELTCRYADQCDVQDCRKGLRCKLEQNLRCAS